MNWLRAFTNNNAVIKNDSSKDRPAGSENLPPDMRIQWLPGVDGLTEMNVWTRSF